MRQKLERLSVAAASVVLVVSSVQTAGAQYVPFTGDPTIQAPSEICRLDPEVCTDDSLSWDLEEKIDALRSWPPIGLSESFTGRVPAAPVEACTAGSSLCGPKPVGGDESLVLSHSHEVRNPIAVELCATDPMYCDVIGLGPGFDDSGLGGDESLSSISLPQAQATATVAVVGALTASSTAPVYTGSFKADRQSVTRLLLRAEASERLVCNDGGQRPPTLWREALLKRAEIRRCSDATAALLEVRKRSRVLYDSILLGRVDRSSEINAFRAMDDYVKSCLTTLDDVARRTPFTRLFGEKFHEVIASNVGMLSRKNLNVPWCTGAIVRITPKLGFQMVVLATAAHCLGQKGPAGANFQLTEVFDELEFKTLGGSEYRIEIAEDMRGYQYSASEDIVLIPLEEEDNQVADLGLVTTSDVDVWDPLYIVSLNPLALAMGRADGLQDMDLLRKGTTISLEPACRVYGIEGARLLNNCQTEQSMSGSPVFALVDGEIRLAAVHRGETGSERIVACGESAAGAANEAVMLPRELTK